jgi:hypothetical protein
MSAGQQPLRPHPTAPNPQTLTHELRLYALVEAIVRDDELLAHRRLADLTRALESTPPREALRFHIFARALSRHLSRAPDSAGNLYLAPFDVRQIRLFDLLARGLPSVAQATCEANRILLSFCRRRAAVTLVDVGIGEGRQLAALLRQMASSAHLPRRIAIVGIEPCPRSLTTARATLEAVAREEGLALDFHEVQGEIEHLSPADWQRVQRLGAGAIVNASFALHHIRKSDERDQVLRRLRALEPEALILTEPDVDHFDPDLRRRFHSCWVHFRATFDLIDASQLDDDEKDLLKAGFFGREIGDILGSPEADRCERHEPLDGWRRRLDQAGFAPAADIRFGLGDLNLTGVLCAVGSC